MHSKYTSWFVALLLTIVSPLALLRAAAQTDDKGRASIHGHAQDPLGKPVANHQVVLTYNGETKYTFVTDEKGDYQGTGILPGKYDILLLKDPKRVYEQFKGVKLTPGENLQEDFDMSTPEFIKTLPEDEQQRLQEIKKQNAAINKENADISKLNGQLKQARQDNHDKKYAEAETLMSAAVQLKPDAAVLWTELGNAQVGLKKYSDAITSLTKAVSLETAAPKPNMEVLGAANNALGEAYASSNKIPEAQAAYDAAAKALPSSAAMYYTNEAIVMNRLGQSDPTATAADKAIAADPNKPIPYYLKGQALITKATVDPKTNKIVAPPGTEEAYEKYLELAPDGPFANDVKQLLDQIGTKIHNSYRAGKKH